jgi:hypothetical protein
MAFEMASDICRVVGAALLIDHDRQIAAHPDRIHVVEEEETIAAKQILHIVLGGRDEDVDALVFEQGVESCRVEGRGLYFIKLSFVHVVSPAAGGVAFKFKLRMSAGLLLKTASILALIFTFRNDFRREFSDIVKPINPSSTVQKVKLLNCRRWIKSKPRKRRDHRESPALQIWARIATAWCSACRRPDRDEYSDPLGPITSPAPS